MSNEPTYSQEKIMRLIQASKRAVDILIDTLEEVFDFDDAADSSKLKTFVESKKIAFFNAKEIILEIEKLETQLKNSDLDLENQEFTSNYLESTSGRIK